MKNETSFMPLVYREYCITKRSLFGNVLSAVMVYGICIMFTLSTKFGNLAKITEFAGVTEIIETTMPVIRMMGIYFSFLMFMLSTGGSEADLKNKSWALYRKSSPVKPHILALARLVYQLIAFVISVGMSLMYLAADGLISGNGISAGDLEFMAVISSYVVLMGVSISVCVELMHSRDKGSLAAMGIVLGAALAVILPIKMSIDTSGQPSPEETKKMLDKLMSYAPLFIAAAALLFVIEGVVMTLLYKRRDK